MATEIKKTETAEHKHDHTTEHTHTAHPTASTPKTPAPTPASTTKTEAKVEAKKEVKGEGKAGAEEKKGAEKKDAKGTAEKKAVVKKKYIPFVEKKNEKKSAEAKANQKLIATHKKKHPVFRGRFGKKNIRRKSIAKWDKWRKPHGIDLDKGLQHGFRPKVGYGSNGKIRGMHPSGYREVMVCNENDLAKVDPKVNAIRISATLGKRKRNIIVAKANEKKIWILN